MDDDCSEETRRILERHLDDYKALLAKVERIENKVSSGETILHEINGGIRVIRFFGWLISGGMVAAVGHAVVSFLHLK